MAGMRNLSPLVRFAFVVALIPLAWGAEVQDEESYDEFSTYAEETEEQEGWSEWSEWSRCSRTCDGGAAVQSRRCLHYAGCRGDSVRYKLCNLDPCGAGSKDFRAVQCSEYDGLPHEGNLYEWEPAEGEDPCALTCRAQGGGPVVTLNPRVRDGTRCKPGELDLCINGRCQTVGCDLRLGSRKRVDACGVCGGDGSTCNKPTYYWDKRANGPCSATCGGGYQMLSAVCVQQGNGRRVSDDLCDHTARPIPVILNCNDQACPTSWKVGEWGACSVSCGSGYQLREVYCEEPRNTSAVRVADHNCDPPMPRHRQPCNLHDCPRWYDGIWSQCSATCGEGIQTRVVLCRDAQGRSSRFCDDSLRPADSRMCRTGVACPPPSTLAHPRHQPYTPSWWGDEHDALASEEGIAPLMPRPQALTADQQVPAEPTYMTGNWSECSVKCGEGVRNRSVTCKIFLEFSRTVAVLPDDQCPGVKPPQSQRCVLPPCSHAMTRHDYPAGEVSDAAHDPPIASLEDAQEDLDFPDDRKIHETPFLPRLVDEDAPSSVVDIKETSLSVPQAEAYNEPRPGLHSFEAPSHSHHQKDPLLLYTDETKGRSQYESYELSRGKSHSPSEHSQINSIEIDMGGGDGNFLETYSVDVSSKASLYEWMTSGFGPCSASCLGGVQESLVKCIRIADQKIVEPQKCNMEERPDIITRTCNDQPCPPRWNVSEFGECSKPCGGGVQMREVKCIHEVTRGGTNTVVVPDSLCPQPPKRTQQYCNILDCPPEWVSSDWSKCSAPCGGGMKTRAVKCQQVMALGQLEERPSRECPFRRPRDRRKCNQRPCQGGVAGPEKSVIRSQTHQDYVQSKFMKKLTLKIGGKATVFRGMRLKVKCPVRRFDRSKITWWHDGRQISRTGAIKTTQKGVLKIRKVQYPDSGVYKCKADRSEANLTLVVIPLPSSYSSSETHETRRPSSSSANEVSLHTHEDTANTDFTYGWNPRKSGKELGREGRRRQGGRNGARRRNGFKGLQITETTLRPVQPFPMGPSSDTLGEGPFKASSKNMHTVEMTSGEATNVYETTDWHTDSRKTDDEYVYGTVTHHMKPNVENEHTLPGLHTDHETTHSNANQLSEEKTVVSEETGHLYGKINHHSDGSRITSEENPIFGTIYHSPLPGTAGRGYSPPRRTEWPSLPTSTEYHSTGTKSGYEEETGNSIEGDLKDLGNKLSLSSEHGSHVDEHRHPSFSWSGQHLGSWSGHSSRSRSGQSDNHMSGHSKDLWSGTEGTPPLWDSSFATVSNNPPTWHSWANTQDQHLHNQQPYEPPGTPYWHAEAPPSPPPAPPITSSGSSRSVPYFQKLLSNLERSRGGRHASSPSDAFGGLVSHGLVRDETTTEDPFGTPENLGKGTRDSLEFEWQMTNWSECSQTCGFTSTSSGFQVRSIQCLVRVNNVSRPVDGALCQDAGLEAPVTMQKCGLTECPQWHFDEWSECESSRCYTLNKAFQRRNVVCQLHNGTIVNSEQCDVRTRPRHRQECYNQHCTGVWRVGDWSECTAPCGGHGYRTRLLQCVWNGTKKAAGNACRELPRPEVVRWCDGQPCPDPNLEKTSGAKDCRDRNKYCNIVRRVNMCRVQNYREQCCRSCP
ncbi:protein madd-4-like isoform X2 [Macrobrachium nipponense]|uniref:protein madd-4-like isoform X2 n=1 Tax=Macrobrachium nipponense TaxID=159736 RepID=UPI0030C857EC